MECQRIGQHGNRLDLPPIFALSSPFHSDRFGDSAREAVGEGELLAHRKFATAGFHDESGEPGRGPRSQRPEQGNARLGCNEEESNECRQDAAAEE